MASREPSDEPLRPCSARSLVARKVRIGDVAVGTRHGRPFQPQPRSRPGSRGRGPGGHLHFLPWVAARLGNGDIAPISVFALLSASELSFYLENGVRLTLVLNAPGDAGSPLGDVLVDRDGDVAAAVPRLSGATPFAAGAAG